jgi:hypothetical protein
MLGRVALVRTDVSEERIVFIIVERISELGTALAVASNRRTLLVTANIVSTLPILVTLTMEVIHYSEISVLTRATRRKIPEHGIIHYQYSYNSQSRVTMMAYVAFTIRLLN